MITVGSTLCYFVFLLHVATIFVFAVHFDLCNKYMTCIFLPLTFRQIMFCLVTLNASDYRANGLAD